MENLIGQISDNEFRELLSGKINGLSYKINYENRTAWVKYGKSTINYYIQHEDKSWTKTHKTIFLK